MPIQIPTYISRTAPKVVDRGGTSPESTGLPVARGLRSVTSALADIEIDAEKRVGDAARLGEFAARKGQLTDRLGALEDSLAADPDHRTYFDRAKKGIEEATTEVLSGVNDPALKNALTAHVSDLRDRSLVDARHKARALTIDFTRGAIEEGIDRNVKAAVSATDARDLMRAEGEIDAAVAGAVKGGVYTAEHGGRVARAAREKIATVQAEQMADKEPGRFLSNYKEGLYKERVDPLRIEGIRRYAENRVLAVDALASAGDVWEALGPKADSDPVNLDRMAAEVEKSFPGEPEKARLAMASLRERAVAHDKGVAERKDASLSAVWKASLAGQGIAAIQAMPEYSALDGNSQRLVKEHLEDRSWTMKGRAETDTGRKAAQHEAYWRYSQPPVLAGMTESGITALYPTLGVELTDDLMKEKRRGDTPGKAPVIDMDVLNHFAREYGIKPEDRDNKPILGEITYKVKREIEAEESARKRPLTRPEKEQILKRGLVEVEVPATGFFGKTTMKKRLFDVEYPGNILIPKADRDRIAADLTARGLPVTDNTVRALYLRMKEK